MAYINYIKYLNGEEVRYTDFVSEEEFQKYLGLLNTRR